MFKKILHINLEGIAELELSSPSPMGLFNDAEPLIALSDHVYLLDAVFGCLSLSAILGIVNRLQPELVVLAYSGKSNDFCYVSRLKMDLLHNLPETHFVLGHSMSMGDWQLKSQLKQPPYFSVNQKGDLLEKGI